MKKRERTSFFFEQRLGAVLQKASGRIWPDKPLSLLVAFSGGLDSRVLLHALMQLSTSSWRGKLGLSAAHFNHGLRSESAAEEEFVVKVCADYGIELKSGRAQSKPDGVNLESWAREARYAFLDRTRREAGADLIVTAHHQSDQAETLLYRLLTGRFCRASSSIGELDLRRTLFRPLLSVPKRSIEEYAAANDLQAVVDRSNFDLQRTRNLLRHRIIPELEAKINPNVQQSLTEAAARLNEDENQLWREARLVLSGTARQRNKETLLQLPAAIAWRVLALQAENELGEDAAKVGYGRLRHALALIGQGAAAGKVLELGHGVCLRFKPNGIWLFEQQAGKESATELQTLVLKIPGRETLYGGRAAVEAEIKAITAGEEGLLDEIRQSSGHWEGPASAWFDLQELGLRELTIRSRREGDTVHVWSRGTRKLKKLMQEAHIPIEARDGVPVIERQGLIIWVPGVARSSVAPISTKTTEVVRLNYRRC